MAGNTSIELADSDTADRQDVRRKLSIALFIFEKAVIECAENDIDPMMVATALGITFKGATVDVLGDGPEAIQWRINTVTK